MGVIKSSCFGVFVGVDIDADIDVGVADTKTTKTLQTFKPVFNDFVEGGFVNGEVRLRHTTLTTSSRARLSLWLGCVGHCIQSAKTRDMGADAVLVLFADWQP